MDMGFGAEIDHRIHPDRIHVCSGRSYVCLQKYSIASHEENWKRDRKLFGRNADLVVSATRDETH